MNPCMNPYNFSATILAAFVGSLMDRTFAAAIGSAEYGGRL